MPILEKAVYDAIKSWSDGILDISHSFETEGIVAAKIVATNMLDSLYDFDNSVVLFKPTLSGGKQTFRPTKQGALSYFVGQDPKYPLDTGFGIKFWRKIESDTAALLIDETFAMWMGKVSFSNKDGQTTIVDKSWVYKLDEEGVLRIILHHSSLPFEH